VVQVPGVAPHVWQLPPHAVWQQTVPTQYVEAHWVLRVQAAPAGSDAVQNPALQKLPVAHSVSATQLPGPGHCADAPLHR
jgi:hypothetical protein